MSDGRCPRCFATMATMGCVNPECQPNSNGMIAALASQGECFRPECAALRTSRDALAGLLGEVRPLVATIHPHGNLVARIDAELARGRGE